MTENEDHDKHDEQDEEAKQREVDQFEDLMCRRDRASPQPASLRKAARARRPVLCQADPGRRRMLQAERRLR
jgi:hypothetical protein